MKIFLERKNIMKRVLSLILAGLLTAGTAVAMISCNNNETNNDGEKQPITENDGPQLELPTDVKGGARTSTSLSHTAFPTETLLPRRKPATQSMTSFIREIW